MIIATWAIGADGAHQFPDKSGWFVRVNGRVMGGVFWTREAARAAYRRATAKKVA